NYGGTQKLIFGPGTKLSIMP
uniref:Uncharacterized protein n=1 Tax=Sarcophilus harrisii TaxID=9305 RepID=A0A7N4NJV2_SARHA